MPDVRPFTVVEIDLPVCGNTYGVAPCTATIDVDNPQKCFNTRRTCQDLVNFTPSTTTLRVCMPTEDIPYDAVGCLESVSVTPGSIDPGRSIGTRGKVSVTCAEFQTGDALLDRYLADRTYDPFTQGTFWAKLRARLPNLQGSPLRVMRGEFGADLSTFRTEHYFVESAVIAADGIQITAKDALSFCDPKKAQCPLPSSGRLDDDLAAGVTTATLAPTGIGNLEYPASGVACLAGKELVDFTRLGDVVTLTRGQYGTDDIEHDVDAAFQLAAVFDSMSVADITYSLLTDYTPGVDAAWCDLPAWQTDADTFVGHLYHAIIAAPTSVKTLLDEMMVTAGCSIWWDPEQQQVKFQTLRPVAAGTFVLDNTRMLEGAFAAKEQPDKRVSQHLTYYGQANPTVKLEKESNFRAAVLRINTDAETFYGSAAYDKVFARWISVDNRPAAERLNAMKLARYSDPPRLAETALFATSPHLPSMGQCIPVQDFSLQNPDGSAATVNFYITGVTKGEVEYRYALEEITFDESLLDDAARGVYIDVDRFNVNLRTLYDSLYSSVPPGATIIFTVSPGAYVGGQVLGGRSLDVGSWPETPEIHLYIASLDNGDAKVLGRGGDGAGYPGIVTDGEAGSTAIYTRYPIRLWNYGQIGAGGGGGEDRNAQVEGAFYFVGGGGGAGFNGYDGTGARRGGRGGTYGGQDGRPTTLGGGDGGNDVPGPGGDGGNLGQPGRTNAGADGHSAAGVAIDGVSYVTFEVTGTITGSQIN